MVFSEDKDEGAENIEDEDTECGRDEKETHNLKTDKCNTFQYQEPTFSNKSWCKGEDPSPQSWDKQ